MTTKKATSTDTADKTAAPIRALVAKYPTLLNVDHPVYRLPKAALDSLRTALVRKRPLLDKADVAFELALANLCDGIKAIGVWMGRPVQYGYLQEPSPGTIAGRKGAGGKAKQRSAGADSGMAAIMEIRQRLKGYAGWLVTDRDFLAARDQLAESWEQLPPRKRPQFPLQRATGTPALHAGERDIAASVAQFRQDLGGFLDHWGLSCMVTWDLPEPQPPLLPASIPNDAAAISRHGLHIVLPVHFPVSGSDELLFEIRRQQMRLARERGLDASIAALTRHQALGRMLEADHIERTIRSRYADRRRNAGLVQVMKHAIADALHIRVNHVERLRKAISACKQGKRDSVSWLRTRADGSVG